MDLVKYGGYNGVAVLNESIQFVEIVIVRGALKALLSVLVKVGLQL